MPYKTDPKAPPISIREILANSITHGIGVGLSIAGIVFLIIKAIQKGSAWHLAGFIIFGVSLILLYLASTMYHCFANKPIKAFLQRLDHTAIFFLIAGTYTPYILTKLRNGWGWSILGIIWGLSIFMLVIKLCFKSKFEKPSVFLYLAMGWFGAVVFFLTMGTIGYRSLFLLLLGGIFYSAGVIFYRWRSLPFSHAIWHIFVLLGSISHYFSILKLA